MHTFKHFLYLMSIFLFFSSFDKLHENPKQEIINVTAEERAWLSKFFREIMLDDHAIYTLWGSKPLTLITIDEYTNEEMQAHYNSLSEEEKKDLIYIADEKYDFPENWKKWEKISTRFPLKNYLFFKSEFHKEPKTTFVYFVNILNTAHVIEEHYTLFRKIIGFDFNPLQAVLEINKKDSKFWKKVQKNALLNGILFGFGKKNALTFHWKHFDHPVTCKHFLESMEHHFSNAPIQRKEAYSIQDFPIPAFISFDENDEIVEKYKKERAYIQEVYKGKDFLDVTLKRLTR